MIVCVRVCVCVCGPCVCVCVCLQHYNSVRMADDPGIGPPLPIVIRGDGVIRKAPAASGDGDNTSWGDREVERVMKNTACDDMALVSV